MKRKRLLFVAGAAVLIAAAGVAGFFFSREKSLEIERKWLISADEIPYSLEEMECFDITQTYLSYDPETRVRKIVNGGLTYYTKTVKKYVNELGLVREENEWYISEDEYLQEVAGGLDRTIYKTRYQTEIDGISYAFDVFHGELDGLAYLEVEFKNENEARAFLEPDWIIRDVTDDRRFKNQSLARFGMPEL